MHTIPVYDAVVAGALSGFIVAGITVVISISVIDSYKSDAYWAKQGQMNAESDVRSQHAQLYRMTDAEQPFKGHIVSESGGNYIFRTCHGREFILFSKTQFTKERGTC